MSYCPKEPTLLNSNSIGNQWDWKSHYVEDAIVNSHSPPWWGSLCCVLEQDTLLSQCLYSPRCITRGTDDLLKSNLRWTRIAFRGSSNTLSRFVLQKPEFSAGSYEPVWLEKALMFTCPLKICNLKELTKNHGQ